MITACCPNCSYKSNTTLEPKFYRQLAPSKRRPFWGRTAVSSRPVAISFSRSTRWDRSRGRRSNFNKNKRFRIPMYSSFLFLFWGGRTHFWKIKIGLLPLEADAKGNLHVCLYFYFLYHIYIYIFICLWILPKMLHMILASPDSFWANKLKELRHRLLPMRLH